MGKLRRFLLRYYPPGIILEYDDHGTGRQCTKSVDLLDLTPEYAMPMPPRTAALSLAELPTLYRSNPDVLATMIVRQESLISSKRHAMIKELVKSRSCSPCPGYTVITSTTELMAKIAVKQNSDFRLRHVLQGHILPLTNCAFNKSGDRFITGSYDRTCKIWETSTGRELLSLEGHKNVVYAIAFNNPFGDRIITGSFDRTCRVWDASDGSLIHILRGHLKEIVCLSFSPDGTLIVTGSMDGTAKIWDVSRRRLSTVTRLTRPVGGSGR